MLQKPDPGISATPHENNLRYFNVVIAGPQDSAYDGADCFRYSSFVLRLLRTDSSLSQASLILCSHSPPLGVF